MSYSQNIDESLKERHGILHLLERLKQDSLTLDDMEEIGTKLQKSGGRALSPLVRRLWRERSSDLISRYAYLLDFFEEEEWMGQLVQIALQRRDLDEEGKAVLLAALKGYGIDINTPPFAKLLAEAGSSLDTMFSRLLDMGDEGFVIFMEDFLCYCRDVQLAMIHEVGAFTDSGALCLLEILLWIDDAEIVKETITVLGTVRSSRSATILENFLGQAEGEIKELAERSLRRLSFLGIRPVPGESGETLPFHAAWASPLDGSGCRSLWISRWRSDRRVAALYMQMHQSEGIKTAWGCSGAVEEVEDQLREISDEEGLVAIPMEYSMILVRDAIACNHSIGSALPADFHVQRPTLFRCETLAPAAYDPGQAVGFNKGAAVPARQIAATPALFEDDFFAGWFISTARVYDFAEEWNDLEQSGKRGGEEALIERFCREIISPDLEQIRQRLLLTADLMRQTGTDAGLIELTIAAAASMPQPALPCHFHPFLRRFALESIEIAREALAEGYDLRQQLTEDDDDEWG